LVLGGFSLERRGGKYSSLCRCQGREGIIISLLLNIIRRKKGKGKGGGGLIINISRCPFFFSWLPERGGRPSSKLVEGSKPKRREGRATQPFEDTERGGGKVLSGRGLHFLFHICSISTGGGEGGGGIFQSSLLLKARGGRLGISSRSLYNCVREGGGGGEEKENITKLSSSRGKRSPFILTLLGPLMKRRRGRIFYRARGAGLI